MFKFKQFLLTGLLAVSLVLISSTPAKALGGYNLFMFGICCSEFDLVVDLSGLGNVEKNPVLLIGTASMDIVEVACVNPAGKSKTAQGTPFDKIVSDTSAFDDDGDIENNGSVQIIFHFDLDEFEDADLCTGKGKQEWTLVPGSLWPRQASIQGEIFACTDLEDVTENGPCFNDDESLAIDSDPITDGTMTCFPPEGTERDADGNPPHVTYVCFADTTGDDISFVASGDPGLDQINSVSKRFFLFTDGNDVTVVSDSGTNDGDFFNITGDKKQILVNDSGNHRMQTDPAPGTVTVSEIPVGHLPPDSGGKKGGKK